MCNDFDVFVDMVEMICFGGCDVFIEGKIEMEWLYGFYKIV